MHSVSLPARTDGTPLRSAETSKSKASRAPSKKRANASSLKLRGSPEGLRGSGSESFYPRIPPQVIAGKAEQASLGCRCLPRAKPPAPVLRLFLRLRAAPFPCPSPAQFIDTASRTVPTKTVCHAACSSQRWSQAKKLTLSQGGARVLGSMVCVETSKATSCT